MRGRPHIQPSALRDVDSICDYIGRDNLDASIRVGEAFLATADFLSENPFSAPEFQTRHPKLRGLRQTSIRGYRNYLIFYKVEQGIVKVTRVIHGARDVEGALLND